MGPCGVKGVLALALLAVALPTAAADARPVPVKAKAPPIEEITPASDDGYFAWARNRRGHLQHINLYLQHGRSVTRVNRIGTEGAAGSIDAGRLVFQEFHGPRSSIVLYNIATHHRVALPAGVNTRKWEWKPSLSGDWLLFGREPLGAGKVHVVLFNLMTHERRLLDTADPRYGDEPGQVSGNWAAFTHCGRRACSVYRHDIGGNALQQFAGSSRRPYKTAAAIDTAGTLYYDSSGSSCGRSRLVRQPLAGGPELLWSFRRAQDFNDTYVEGSGEGAKVYFRRVVCTLRRSSDIYRLTAP